MKTVNMIETYPFLSLLPILVALILAFWSKNAIFALLTGSAVGALLLGMDPVSGLAELFQSALGSSWFIWVLMIEVWIGIIVAGFQRAGVIDTFSEKASKWIKTRRSSSGFAWGLGVFCFFSDYFSPLFSGPIARPLTDKFKVSREKLSYILDSTSAAVPTIIPISGWAVFIAGLLVDHGTIDNTSEAMSAFVTSIPYNFYGFLAIGLAALFAFDIIPDFGPMKKAEKRAQDEGKVIADGSTPMMGKELEEVEPPEGMRGGLAVYLFVPVGIIIGIALSTFFILEDVKILVAFMTAAIYLLVVLGARGFFDDITEAMDTAQEGIKGVLPAIIVLSLAFTINQVTGELGGAEYLISITEAWISPMLLLALTFVMAGIIAFLTGTSWGTYGMMIPFVVPMAFSLNGGALGPIVYATIGAVTGGGVFGDHCSPVSDTTILSSLGAGSDHIDHVSTQIPYAVTAAVISLAMYLVLAFLFL